MDRSIDVFSTLADFAAARKRGMQKEPADLFDISVTEESKSAA